MKMLGAIKSCSKRKSALYVAVLVLIVLLGAGWTYKNAKTLQPTPVDISDSINKGECSEQQLATLKRIVGHNSALKSSDEKVLVMENLANCHSLRDDYKAASDVLYKVANQYNALGKEDEAKSARETAEAIKDVSKPIELKDSDLDKIDELFPDSEPVPSEESLDNINEDTY